MEIRESARKHGIADADILHAFRMHVRAIEQEYDGQERVLFIGPALDGSLLELVVVGDRIIADHLRAKFYRFL